MMLTEIIGTLSMIGAVVAFVYWFKWYSRDED